MTDDDKKEAWRRRCAHLEALALDPYDPQVPPDDSRHAQVQAILTEYKVAIGEVILVPPCWEGYAPLRGIKTLADLAGWLNDQWASTLATEMGGEPYKADAFEQAARAVRNGIRVLACLGVDDRPEPPPPADTLAAAKRQLDDLERWVQQKVKDGWTPPEPSESEDGMVNPATPAKRRKRTDFPNQYEVNIHIEKYLGQHPRATIREVAEVVDLSVGKVSQMDAWRRQMARRKATKPTPQIKERRLTQWMRAYIHKEDRQDDLDDRIDRRDAMWRGIIEEASPTERARLNAMPKNEREALIDTLEEQNADLGEQEYRWQQFCS